MWLLSSFCTLRRTETALRHVDNDLQSAYCGVWGLSLQWFMLYLTDRQQFIIFGQHKGFTFPVVVSLRNQFIFSFKSPSLFIYTLLLGKIICSHGLNVHCWLYDDDLLVSSFLTVSIFGVLGNPAAAVMNLGVLFDQSLLIFVEFLPNWVLMSKLWFMRSYCRIINMNLLEHGLITLHTLRSISCLVSAVLLRHTWVLHQTNKGWLLIINESCTFQFKGIGTFLPF